MADTFVALVDEAPRELVDGTVVGWPPGPRVPLTPAIFRKPLPPGYALAAMNYIVTPDGSGGSLVSTETRVFQQSPPHVDGLPPIGASSTPAAHSSA